MRLQADPTVQYAKVQSGKRELVDDLALTDLETVQSVYNTYVHWLPPSPICTRRVAIEAALNPQSSDYLYFVAKGDGSHVCRYV